MATIPMTLPVYRPLELDVQKPEYQTLQQVYGRQGETALTIRATITDDGQPYDFSGKNIEFCCIKPGGEMVHVTEGIKLVSGSTYDCTLPPEATSQYGTISVAYFRITKTDDESYIDTTVGFVIILDKSATFEGRTGEYSDKLNALIAALEGLIAEGGKINQDAQGQIQAKVNEIAEQFTAAVEEVKEEAKQTFNTNEQSRTQAFEQAQSQRQSTFEASESARQTAETKREEAEQAREAASATAVSNAETATQKANEAASAADTATSNATEAATKANAAAEAANEATTSAQSTESDIEAAEALRVQAETAREAAEAKRQETFETSEQSRSEAFEQSEAERQSAFEAAESERATAETEREAAEAARETWYTETKQAVDDGAFDGATFTPLVAENGDLSWTNDKELPNPEMVNIMGPPGYTADLGGARFFVEVDDNGDLWLITDDQEPMLEMDEDGNLWQLLEVE